MTDSGGFEWLARAGFVARGLIYGIIGLLAIKLALGSGGEVTDQQGALRTVAQQPFGKVLLTVLAIGLGGYAVWRLVHAVLGHGPESTDSRFDRVAALASGIVYAGLCAVAVKMLASGVAASANSGDPKKVAAGVFGWPAGTVLVGIAGAVMIGVGLYQGYRGATRDFQNDSKTGEMPPGVRRWIAIIGTIGHLSRMVVFGLVGIFLIKAAVDYNPNSAIGIDGVLAKLVNRSYGPVVLGVVAGGLVAFGIYSLTDAKYRKI